MESSITLSDEQQAIVDENGNVVATARPGSGKTFTIVQMIKKALCKAPDYKGIIAISFTKKASRELEERCKRLFIDKKASFMGTIDHFYISEIIMPFSMHITNKYVKMEVDDNIREFPEYCGLENITSGITPKIELLLVKALSEGHIFLEYSGEIAYYILNKVKEAREYIVARYTHIFIDEYQDCGEIQHRIFMLLVEMKLIGVAVGDIDQAIYAFTNRYSLYLEMLMKDSYFNKFVLTNNYRCHKSIVAYSLQLLGISSEYNDKEKRVIKVTISGNENEIANQICNRVDQIKKKYDVKKDSDIAILCRNKNTALLIDNYLNRQHKLFLDSSLDTSHLEWSRFFGDLLRDYYDEEIYSIDFASKYVDEDIDKKLFLEVNKLVYKIFSASDDKLINNIYEFKKLALLVLPEYKSNESLKELENVLKDEKERLSYKPAADNEICIMTLHKSKGLEFDIIFHMDLYKWVFPWENISKEELKQSMNLHYVGVTRARKVCYLLEGTQRFSNYSKNFINSVESPFLDYPGLKKLRKDISWK